MNTGVLCSAVCISDVICVAKVSHSHEPTFSSSSLEKCEPTWLCHQSTTFAYILIKTTTLSTFLGKLGSSNRFPFHSAQHPSNPNREPGDSGEHRIQTYRRFKRTLFYQDKTQHENFRGNPLYQATKRQLNGE